MAEEPVKGYIRCGDHMRPAVDPCCWICINNFNKKHGYKTDISEKLAQKQESARKDDVEEPNDG